MRKFHGKTENPRFREIQISTERTIGCLLDSNAQTDEQSKFSQLR